MLYNPTEAEEDAQADEDLRTKLALELLLTPKIKAILDDVATDSEAIYARTGFIITGESWQKRMENTLRQHYGVVQDAFGMQASEVMGSDKEGGAIYALIAAYAARRSMTRREALAELDRINSAMLDEWSIESARKRAGWITDTTTKELDLAYSDATQLMPHDASRDAVAKEGASAFKRANDPRSELISATETQAAAEASKRIDLDAAAIFAAAQIKAKKTWRTRGDDRVRPAHAAANGQTLAVDDPFIVMGQRLQYPGDTSMGATAANVCNCRCSAIYSLS